MKDEINKMTEIEDPDLTGRTQIETNKLKNEMMKKHNVADYFNDIQKDVMLVIKQK